MKTFVIFAVRQYQKYISPFLSQSCRFFPSCSSYCIDAVESRGTIQGLWLSIKRVLRCHPFHPGGYDPVMPVDVQFNNNGEKKVI
ncbi:MAG: hypothetical protein AMK70_09430 [Nitrospira bacterium SG8_35_1]|nr:MAG: hypothetical protein AMK70_09430 [Nitrospira bacterium SG8_35_1]UCH44396.1 MAG: membrane protein insertion efficiency factor YidD [Nitrospiraceae bacterium]